MRNFVVLQPFKELYHIMNAVDGHRLFFVHDVSPRGRLHKIPSLLRCFLNADVSVCSCAGISFIIRLYISFILIMPVTIDSFSATGWLTAAIFAEQGET